MTKLLSNGIIVYLRIANFLNFLAPFFARSLSRFSKALFDGICFCLGEWEARQKQQTSKQTHRCSHIWWSNRSLLFKKNEFRNHRWMNKVKTWPRWWSLTRNDSTQGVSERWSNKKKTNDRRLHFRRGQRHDAAASGDDLLTLPRERCEQVSAPAAASFFTFPRSLWKKLWLFQLLLLPLSLNAFTLLLLLFLMIMIPSPHCLRILENIPPSRSWKTMF